MGTPLGECFWLCTDFPNPGFWFSSMFFPRGVECLTVSASSESGDTVMKGSMMQFPLTLAPLLERAGKLFPTVEVVSSRPDNSIHRYTYREMHQRARALMHLAVHISMN